jgi:DNA-binding transcriptional LysR family regulator
VIYAIIDFMNLRGIDLNLLVILDALLDEAHVTRAAHRLGLTQPATSSALQRCRHLFRDELLERGRGTMRLTRKAQELRGALKSVLADVLSVVDPPEVPLNELRQSIKISMADFPAIIVVGPVLQELAQIAPGIDLVIQPWRGAEQARQALVDRTTDLAMSVFEGTDADLAREHVLDETYQVVMRHGHPAAEHFTLKTWLDFPHIVVSGRGDAHGALDDALAKLNHTRRIGIVVPTFQMVPDLLAASDMIAMLPSRCVPANRAGDFAVFAPPVAVAGFPLHLAWHKRREKDRALQVVKTLLHRAILPVEEE